MPRHWQGRVPEVTYEEFCKNVDAIMAENEKYDAWRVEAMGCLLANLGPRLQALGKVMYCGCGFHYSKEQAFGKLVHGLAMPIKVTANHCDKYADKLALRVCNEVMFEGLVEDIIRAEHCVQARAAGEKCNCEEDFRKKNHASKDG